MNELATIPGVLRRAAQHFPEHPALEAGARRLSYVELLAEAQLTAASLMAAGVQPQERVAIWAPNSCDWVVLALGISLAGASLVPINTRFKAAEAGYLLEKSRARLLFTVGEFLGVSYFEQLRSEHGGPGASHGRPIAGLPHLERVVLLDSEREASGSHTLREHLATGRDVSQAALSAREDAVLPTSISDIMFTSGTTGRPKGVATTHGQNIRAYSAWCAAVGLTQRDRYLIVSPFFHAFGYKAGILACVISGATILPHAVFDAGQVFERLQNEAISVLPGPPTLYQSLLSHPGFNTTVLPPLRLAVTGAAVVPLELVERMKRELGFQTVVTGYGLTESCGIATMCRVDDDTHTIASTSGRAIDGVEVRVVDSSGTPLPSGEPGEVVIRGYNVMQGYFEAPEDTREVIDAEGFLHTGDIGVLDAHGNLRITDRLKDMYIAGGFNCYPAEIERTLSTHPGIAQVAVIGIPDVRLGEVGMAFIVPRPGHFVSPLGMAMSTASPDLSWSDSLTAFCRERMANYKVPRRFAIVQELPLNAAGKVVKGRLRERVAHSG